MHKLIATSTILEHELSELRLLVERQTGIVLDCPNSALAAHVADFIEAQELGIRPARCWNVLRSSEQDPASLPSLLDGLINTNTGFFRHPGALNALTRQVLPQFLRASLSTGRVRSAFGVRAAPPERKPIPSRWRYVTRSTPPISKRRAMATDQRKRQTERSTRPERGHRRQHVGYDSVAKLGPGCSIHIVGSDLLPRNIEAADRGVYRQSALEGLPPATHSQLFFEDWFARCLAA